MLFPFDIPGKRKPLRVGQDFCGLCLFALPKDTKEYHVGGFSDKGELPAPNANRDYDELRFRSDQLRDSGLRGCEVCATVFRTLQAAQAELKPWRVSWIPYGNGYALDADTANSDTRDQTGYLTSSFQFWADQRAKRLNRFINKHPYVIRYHPNPGARVDMDSSVRALRFWMDTCLDRHKLCRKWAGAQGAKTALPTRVLQIRNNGGPTPMVRLLESRGRRGQYLCLSHCWGSLRPDCITTRSTYHRNTSDIPWASLPPTFQEAIRVTQLLGREFIWIDSICIIQDDESDWLAEAANMCAVYENSWLTLMASKAANALNGLLGREETQLLIAQIPDARAEGQLFFRQNKICDPVGWLDRTNPLLCRAWAFQERCLSHRTAQFSSHGLQYECIQALDCDCGESKTDRPVAKYGSGAWTAPRDRNAFLYQWRDVVDAYTKLELTCDSDRLPALAGMARQFATSRLSRRGYHPGRYLAGLWEENLAVMLAWEPVTVHGKAIHSRPSCFVAPTWSWASLKGPVTMKWTGLRCEITLQECNISLKDQDEFGQVKSLSLRVSAKLLPGILKRVSRDPVTESYYASHSVHVGSDRYPLTPDCGMNEKMEHILGDDIDVVCISVINPYRTKRAGYIPGLPQGLLVLSLADWYPGAFERVGVCHNVHHSKEEILKGEFDKLTETSFTMV